MSETYVLLFLDGNSDRPALVVGVFDSVSAAQAHAEDFIKPSQRETGKEFPLMWEDTEIAFNHGLRSGRAYGIGASTHRPVFEIQQADVYHDMADLLISEKFTPSGPAAA